MAEDRPEAAKSATGGLLGAVNLPPKALLAVAVLAVAVWWYFQSHDMPLDNWETAVVVLALALLFAAARAVFGLFRRRAPAADKPQ